MNRHGIIGRHSKTQSIVVLFITMETRNNDDAKVPAAAAEVPVVVKEYYQYPVIIYMYPRDWCRSRSRPLLIPWEGWKQVHWKWFKVLLASSWIDRFV